MCRQGVIEEDLSLSKLTVSLTCEDTWLLSKTANTHIATHTHARLLSLVAPVLLGPVSRESLTSIITHSPLAGPQFGAPLKSVLDRLPYSFLGVHEWLTKNVLPTVADDALLMWDMEQLTLLMDAVKWLPLAKMRQPDECIEFCWHEMMRVYTDKLMGEAQVRPPLLVMMRQPGEYFKFCLHRMKCVQSDELM